MRDPETSIPLILATLASLAAIVLAVRRLRCNDVKTTPLWPLHATVGAITLLCLGSFIFRVAIVHQAWQPVQAHVDGLLLLAVLLGFATVYIQSRPKLFGLSIFVLPLLTLILGWGVCATLWTYRAFDLDTFTPAWAVFHLTATYLGLLGCAIGAAAGAMYLFVQGRLKSKAGMGQVNPMASLETLETLIIRAATLGFVLLTLSLVSGFVMVTQSDAVTSLGKAWWSSPKVWLAAAAWVVYAVLINVRSFSTVRGRRAAWLAIAGLVLVLATYGAVEALDRVGSDATADTRVIEEAD
jgi:ABC-type uncharacterized transport system permease subunit